MTTGWADLLLGNGLALRLPVPSATTDSLDLERAALDAANCPDCGSGDRRYRGLTIPNDEECTGSVEGGEEAETPEPPFAASQFREWQSAAVFRLIHRLDGQPFPEQRFLLSG